MFPFCSVQASYWFRIVYLLISLPDWIFLWGSVSFIIDLQQFCSIIFSYSYNFGFGHDFNPDTCRNLLLKALYVRKWFVFIDLSNMVYYVTAAIVIPFVLCSSSWPERELAKLTHAPLALILTVGGTWLRLVVMWAGWQSESRWEILYDTRLDRKVWCSKGCGL